MPLTITNELTNQTWALSVPAGLPIFMFNGPPWKPGAYRVVNTTGHGVIIVLFGQGFELENNDIWRFMAHADLESFDSIGGAPPVAQNFFPYNFFFRSRPGGIGPGT